MAANAKRVFYFEHVQDPIYVSMLEERADVTVTRLEHSMPSEEKWSVVKQSHAYQIGSTRDELPVEFQVNDEFLSKVPNLLIVSTNGAGYDTVDVDACTRAGVIAVNQAGGNKEAVAEHVMALVLALSKRISETDRYMRRENDIRRNEFIGNDILGKTIGIVGLGHVGGRVAEICRAAFNMRVLAYDPYLTADQVTERGAEKVELEQLLAESDYVSINCPRNAETVGMIGDKQFGAMKKTAYFVTTARGGIHDEEALYRALKEKRIAGAGLDVWAKEPPPKDHPLMEFENVLVSPHTAGVTRESRRNIAIIGAEQMAHIFDGYKPPRLLNPEAWPAYAERFKKAFGIAVKE